MKEKKSITMKIIIKKKRMMKVKIKIMKIQGEIMLKEKEKKILKRWKQIKNK